MQIRKLAAASILTVAAIGLTSGTAYADPAPAPASSNNLDVELAPRINYRAFDNGGAAVITTDAGSITVANGQFQILAGDGTVVGGVPLELRVDDMSMPIDAQIDGNTATLTPDPARAVYKPVAMPFQDSAPWKTQYEREQAA